MITQPVLVQSLQDKVNLPDGVPPTTPATLGTTLNKPPEENQKLLRKIPIIKQALAKYNI